MRHDHSSKAGGTVLNWQTPVACTAGIVMFILLGESLQNEFPDSSIDNRLAIYLAITLIIHET